MNQSIDLSVYYQRIMIFDHEDDLKNKNYQIN